MKSSPKGLSDVLIWIQATESLIGGRQQTYYQVRHDLAYFSGEDDIITTCYQRVLGTGPTADQIASAKQDLDNGGSITTSRQRLPCQRPDAP